MKHSSSTALTVAGALLLLGCIAGKAQACQGVDQTLSAERKQEMAAKVADSLTTSVDPAGIDVTRYMTSGQWTLVWAAPPDTEEGVFFFEKAGNGLQFKDVWGGYAEPSEKPDLIRWAHDQGTDFPDPLARCFADAVTQG